MDREIFHLAYFDVLGLAGTFSREVAHRQIDHFLGPAKRVTVEHMIDGMAVPALLIIVNDLITRRVIHKERVGNDVEAGLMGIYLGCHLFREIITQPHMHGFIQWEQVLGHIFGLTLGLSILGITEKALNQNIFK